MVKTKDFSFTEEELEREKRALFPSFKTEDVYRELQQAFSDGDITTYIHLQLELEEIQKRECSWQF